MTAGRTAVDLEFAKPLNTKRLFTSGTEASYAAFDRGSLRIALM